MFKVAICDDEQPKDPSALRQKVYRTECLPARKYVFYHNKKQF